MTSSYTPGLIAIVVIVVAASMLALYLIHEEIQATRREHRRSYMHNMFSERTDDDYADDDYIDADEDYDYTDVAPVQSYAAGDNIQAYAALSRDSGEFFAIIRADETYVPEFNPVQSLLPALSVVPTSLARSTTYAGAYAKADMSTSTYSTSYYIPNPHYTGRHRTEEVSGTATQRMRGYCAPAAAVRPAIPIIPGSRQLALTGGRA